MNQTYIYRACRCSALKPLWNHGSTARAYHRPSFAPRPVPDLKHIRNNPGLYEQNCIDRNYAPLARNAWQILQLHEQLVDQQRQVVELRQRNNVIGKVLGQQASKSKEDGGQNGRTRLLEEAKGLKHELLGFETREKEVREEMERLALELPNLSSLNTPPGEETQLLDTIGDRPAADDKTISHVDIGRLLNIIDFEASATTSGWGWYFLKNEGALLEQALVQYTLSVALSRGWTIMTPPSLVYSHIASACGFMPRDQNGETQIYSVTQNEDDHSADKPSLVLAGTAEIPFAGIQANRILHAEQLPLRVIGPSRCYRAEAGARGVDTKGLYRVHEFTKVEMFAWTLPNSEIDGDRFGGDESSNSQTDQVFAEMLEIQREILSSLGLHAKVLEMPATDLGASATRKIDIEAYFPSRQNINSGYGEVTSASICTDYQSRRLGTRLKQPGETKHGWPYTINGTAMAVPRVLACILENHWDESTSSVRVPEVLRRYMPGDLEAISRKTSP